MRVIRVHFYTKGGAFQIWPNRLLTWQDIDLARKIATSIVDIDANSIKAIHLYSSEEDYYSGRVFDNPVAVVEEMKESDTGGTEDS
jgi:hypothetical protein